MTNSISAKKFQRKKEDFICEHCGVRVEGSGYTNHCPVCLWSKHVDVNPGDRAAQCGGMMWPERIETEKGEYVIVHRCEKCGYKKRNKAAKDDNFNEMLRISTTVS